MPAHRAWSVLLVSGLLASGLFAPSHARAESETAGKRTVTRLADGVYEIRHDLTFGSGNTTVIIGDRQVFVVDSCFLPSEAREDIAQIRQWTGKPVTYLLNTHFHNDHNNGNRAYMEAFPALTIIAQKETKRDMDLIQPGNIQRKPKDDEKRMAAYRQGKDTDGRALSEEEKQQANEVIPKLERMEGEFRALVYQSPTLTFTDMLDIDIGGREVQVEHVGRGHTPGDTIVYLPTEKILVAGDLLVYPIPHIAFAGYPGDWVTALERLERFEATTIVTGHGSVLHDKTYLRLVIELLQSALSQVRARISQLGHPAGYTVDAIRGAVDLTPFRFRFAGDDKDRQEEFDDQMKRMVELIFKEESLR